MKKKFLLKHVRFYEKHRIIYHKSNMHIYLQCIDDCCGRTICSVSTLDIVVREKFATDYYEKKNKVNVLWGRRIGVMLAHMIKSGDIDSDAKCVFDVRGFRFGAIAREIVSELRGNGVVV